MKQQIFTSDGFDFDDTGDVLYFTNNRGGSDSFTGKQMAITKMTLTDLDNRDNNW